MELLCGEIIIKAKGVNNSKLSLDDFITLYKGNDVESIRFEYKIDFNIGYVNLNIPEKIVLNWYAYTKRTKIFKLYDWVDTKPLYYNIHNKSDVPVKTYDKKLNGSININKKKKKY